MVGFTPAFQYGARHYMRTDLFYVANDVVALYRKLVEACLPHQAPVPIMHYELTAFSKNGRPTIEVIGNVPSGVSAGQRTALSSGDIAATRAINS
jgi:hypothetical protein